MADLVALKAELDAGHPTTGPYSADDAIAADELNAINRDAPADSQAMLAYLTLERFRGSTLYGRIKVVAEADPNGQNLPLGVDDAAVAVKLKHIASAKSLLQYVDTGTNFNVPNTDSRFDRILENLDVTGNGCQCINNADKTALVALSQNKQSRVTELGLGRVRAGEVNQARQLS